MCHSVTHRNLLVRVLILCLKRPDVSNGCQTFAIVARRLQQLLVTRRLKQRVTSLRLAKDPTEGEPNYLVIFAWTQDLHFLFEWHSAK